MKSRRKPIIEKIAEATVWVGFMSIAYAIVTFLAVLTNYLHNACYK